MTSTLLLARRHVTFSMSPESDETFLYCEPGSCPGFPPCLISDPPLKGAVLTMLIKWCFKSVLISMKSPNTESSEEMRIKVLGIDFGQYTNYEDMQLILPLTYPVLHDGNIT